jgi:thiamine monophosphate synthase
MTSQTTPDDLEYIHSLFKIELAVSIEISLYQIREKNLPARMLYEFVSRAAEITRGTNS